MVATGTTLDLRRLYTDNDRILLDAKCAIILNGLGFGSIRGDLASRMVVVELSPMDEGDRLSEKEVADRLKRAQGPITSALLHLAAQVMHLMQGTVRAPSHRMMDHMLVSACVDTVLNNNALFTDSKSATKMLVEVQDTLAAEAADTDAFLSFLKKLPESKRAAVSAGTLLEHLQALDGYAYSRSVPTSGAGVRVSDGLCVGIHPA